MTPTKQTVYLPVEITEEFWEKYDSGERPNYELVDANTGERLDEWANKQKAFVFTPEQLNEYTANIIKQALDTAVEKAEREWCSDGYSTGMWREVLDKQSITNTFDETYKQFEV